MNAALKSATVPTPDRYQHMKEMLQGLNQINC